MLFLALAEIRRNVGRFCVLVAAITMLVFLYLVPTVSEKRFGYIFRGSDSEPISSNPGVLDRWSASDPEQLNHSISRKSGAKSRRHRIDRSYRSGNIHGPSRSTPV